MLDSDGKTEEALMKVSTFEARVENGRVILPANVRLPEKAKVYVVVPGVEVQPVGYVGSPRLAHPEQAADFVKEVSEEGQNAELR
jgi:hypothetical protein